MPRNRSPLGARRLSKEYTVTRSPYRAVFLALTLAALLPQEAAAQSYSGPYLEARGGAVFVEDADFDDTGSITGELTYDPGIAVDLAFGYAFEDVLRLELQLGHRKSDTDKVKIDGVGTIDRKAELTTINSMANLYIDFGRFSGDPGGASRFVPFLGFGVGVGIHQLHNLESGGGISEPVFAYQGIAGLAYSLSTDWRLTLSYIYLRTSDPEFDDLDTEYRSHNAMLGVGYSF